MEAVILAAGTGRRAEPISSGKPKCLFPILGKPLLHYIAKALYKNNIKMIIVTSQNWVGTIKHYFPNAEYVIQAHPLGTANAVEAAKNKIEGKEFLVINGDIFFDTSVIEKIVKEEGNVIVAKKSDEPWKYGTLVIKEGKVVGILEKEESIKPPAFVNAGIYKFSKEIFKFIEKTERSVRNEYELTTSITKHIFEGGEYTFIEIEDWIDVGFPHELLEANKIAFAKAKSGRRVGGKSEGKVIVEENVKINNSRIKNSFIGKNTIIEDSVIDGSYISQNVKIFGSYIKDSVIMENTEIQPFCYIPSSVICENVIIGSSTTISDKKFNEKEIKIRVGEKEFPIGKKFGCVIGANSQIGIGSKIMPGKRIGRNCIVYPMSIVNFDIPDYKSYR
ncbi:MAG: sugar phosphate nucleotidyltransferase [Candidatus Micrarchaeia archaeon]